MLDGVKGRTWRGGGRVDGSRETATYAGNIVRVRVCSYA